MNTVYNLFHMKLFYVVLVTRWQFVVLCVTIDRKHPLWSLHLFYPCKINKTCSKMHKISIGNIGNWGTVIKVSASPKKIRVSPLMGSQPCFLIMTTVKKLSQDSEWLIPIQSKFNYKLDKFPDYFIMLVSYIFDINKVFPW